MAFILADSDFQRVFDKRTTDCFNQGVKYQMLRAMAPTFATIASTQEAYEEFFYVTGIVGSVPEFNGALTYASMFPGFHMKFEPKEYAWGLQAQRKLIDDAKWPVFNNRAEMLGKKFEDKKEELFARLFTQATSTAYDFMTSEEGKPLCSSTHLTKAGVSTTSGFDNTYSTALNPTSLAAFKLKLRKLKTDTGDRFEGWENVGLVVPEALEDMAREIVNSDKKPDTAENNINVAKGGYKIITYRRLDDADSTDWYLVDLDNIKKDFIFFNRINPEYKNTVDFDTYALLQAGYMRCGYGFKGWRSIGKSTVS